MVIDFSKVNLKEKPVLILRNLDGTAIQTLGYAFNVNAEILYNEVSTLTFDLPSKVSNVNTPHYSDVVGMRIIDLKDWGQFVLIDPEETSDGVRKLKSCKAYSLEYEFAKKNITLENGTYNFWNPLSPDNTIIGRILEKFPDWSVGYIDPSLVGKYRTFEVIDDKVYNFIKSNVQETYGCIFEFDTYKRTINVVSTALSDDTEPPKPIYLSSERLIKEVKISEDSDSIITCLDVNGGDGVSIRSVNPTGTNKIYNLDYFMNETNFSEDFIEKWRAWESDCEQQKTHYFNTTMEYNLQVARLVTEQAALTDLKGELTSLENVQATIIQGIAQNLKEQDDLDEVNADIKAMKRKISNKEGLIESINEDIEDLLSSLSNVNSMLSMENYFTDKELSILQKYFIEDSLQDESFVAASATTYDNEDISNSINGAELSLDDGDIELTYDGDNKTMYSISGGTISISSLTADVVKATVEFNDDTFVFTSYLNDGTVGEASFESGCITAVGSYKIVSKNSSRLSFMIYEGTLYFTKNTTDYEQHAIEEELYEYGKQVLDEKAEPTYNFSIESGNFLVIDDFISFKNELTMGKRAYLKIDEQKPITPYVIAIKINFEKKEDFTLGFSSSYTSSDRSFRLAKLLEQSVSMGKTLNAKSGVYSEFVNSGASTRVKTFMDSALDIAKNTVMSSGNQAIEFGDAGIRVRKWADDSHTSYSDEQIWIVDNVIAFTTDNWATSNMAIGKIYDENIMNEDGTKGGFAYGIAAPYLVGTILAGENLIIDTENGAFKVDESGVYIDSLKFYITHDGETYDTTLEDELNAMKEASDKIAEDMNEAIQELNEDIARTVTTYYQDTMPDDAHEGDLWYSTGTSYKYMFRNINEGDVLKAIDYNRDLQPVCTVEEMVITLSDGTTFISNTDGTLVDHTGEIIYSNGVWTDLAYGWSSVSDDSEYPYAITVNKDSPFYEAIIGNCYTEFITGKLYRFNGKTWDEVSDSDIVIAIENAATAQATADKKIVSYYQNYAPYQPTEGDIWYNTASSKSVTRHIEVGDDLSQITLYFDKNNFPTSYSCVQNELVIETANEKYNAGIYITTVPNTLVVRQGTTYYHIYNYSTKVLQRENITLSSFFGVVTSVDKNSPFYTGITATFTNNYEPKKLYRYDGYAWILVEDGDIEKIQSNVSTINETLSDIITTEGYLKASKLNGVIDGVNAQMQAAKGNVLFDSDGIWLLNNTTKATSTKAIWMNENGMMFGAGSAGVNPADTDSGWSWTTAINHDGIVAEALAGKYLSGCQIYGGYLNIGNGNFVVTEDGELTAKRGTFKGVVQASDFKDASGQSMMSDYKFTSEFLSLYGLEIKNQDTGETTLLIDTDGNITLKGSITLGTGSKIEWSNIDETGSSAYIKATNAYSYAGDAYDYAVEAYDYADSAYSRASSARTLAQNIANGKYSNGTFIDGTSIYSPEIYANEFNVFPENDGDNEGSFNLYSYYGSTLYHFLKIWYYEGDAPYIHFSSPDGAYANWNFNYTWFRGTIDFSSATVTGLTARFG